MENFIDGYDKIIMYYGNNERAWLKFNSNKILNKYNTMFFLCSTEILLIPTYFKGYFTKKHIH